MLRKAHLSQYWSLQILYFQLESLNFIYSRTKLRRKNNRMLKFCIYDAFKLIDKFFLVLLDLKIFFWNDNVSYNEPSGFS